MSLYLIVGLVAASVALAIVAVAELVAAYPRGLARQLSAVGNLSRGVSTSGGGRVATSARVASTLGWIGAAMLRRPATAVPVRDLLVQAGFRRAEALSVFWGARTALCVGLPIGAAAATLLAGGGAGLALAGAAWALPLGALLPKIYLRQRAGARRREIDRNLPDALDLLVVCMEAGLGLNQAMARVSEEIRYFSAATSDEFVLVNLEIRAGVPREDALRSLGARMGVADLRSLSTMLIQADRFGTSIAQALRVHAETAREKRRQRAEELAAKTTVKLIFPLVLCVFPAVFVVILGPAVISLLRSMTTP